MHSTRQFKHTWLYNRRVRRGICTQTYRAVVAYQKSVGLSADGIIGCNTWRSLQEDVVGTGRTSTTID